MCKAIEDYAQTYSDERVSESRIKMIADFLSNGGASIDAIRMLNASESEVEKAKELLLQPVNR